MEPIPSDLEAAHCLESVDSVGGPEVRAFRRRLRLRQARWREAQDLPIGHEPIIGGPGSRLLGSRIDLCHARESLENLITKEAKEAAVHRVLHPQKHQTLNTARLWADLLSSMPMCFNLFGDLWRNKALAEEAVHAWWPETQGTVSAVEFEWSPGRRDPGYLNDRTSFDVAFILDLPDGGQGVIGIETKYHEWAAPERVPKKDRLDHYVDVMKRAEAHKADALPSILGKDLQQIWRDHLLALSMPLHPAGGWDWARFVLVYPEENVSFGDAADRYARTLLRKDTFVVSTVEQLLEREILPSTKPLRERYL